MRKRDLQRLVRELYADMCEVKEELHATKRILRRVEERYYNTLAEVEQNVINVEVDTELVGPVALKEVVKYVVDNKGFERAKVEKVTVYPEKVCACEEEKDQQHTGIISEETREKLSAVLREQKKKEETKPE